MHVIKSKPRDLSDYALSFKTQDTKQEKKISKQNYLSINAMYSARSDNATH